METLVEIMETMVEIMDKKIMMTMKNITVLQLNINQLISKVQYFQNQPITVGEDLVVPFKMDIVMKLLIV